MEYQIKKLYNSRLFGIQMGTKCAPLVADLFLYSYEADFVHIQKSKFKKKKSFNLTFHYIDDENPLCYIITYPMIYFAVSRGLMKILPIERCINYFRHPEFRNPLHVVFLFHSSVLCYARVCSKYDFLFRGSYLIWFQSY